MRSYLRMLFALVTAMGLLLAPWPGRIAATVSAAPLADSPLTELPRTCGSGLPAGSAGAACCMFGYVIIDGRAVANAEVYITNTRNGETIEAQTAFGPDSDQPYYAASLSAPPLSAAPDDVLTVVAYYSTHHASLSHTALAGGQQVDVVLPPKGAQDYAFDRQIWQQAPAGRFSLFKGDVAVDGAGLVYVADYGNARVQVFTRSGQFVRQWGTFGDSGGRLVHPASVVVDRLGMVYVADYSTRLVSKYTSTGEWLETWGAFDGSVEEFFFPVDLAVDDSFLYVVDQGYGKTPRIKKLTPDGRVVDAWTTFSNGSESLTVDNPEGIAVGGDGLLYIADTGHNRVIVATRSGALVRSWDGSGTAAGTLSRPRRLTVSPSGHVIVSDTDNDRIVIFSATGAFINTLDTYGLGDGEIFKPSGITTDREGNIFVVDAANRLQVFDTQAAHVRTWGGEGDAPGRIDRPLGIAFDGAGNVYVTDGTRGRVRKYSAAGAWLADIRVPASSGNNGLNYPLGIAAKADGSLFVVDADNSLIRVLAPDGSLRTQWEITGACDGDASPNGIALDAAGDVYVTDDCNHRLQKFKANGELLWTAGGPQAGNGANKFNGPYGVALSPDGSTVYVADIQNHRIQRVRASDGAPLGPIGSYGGGPGQLKFPTGVAVAPDGTLFVAEYGGYRIQRLSPDGASLSLYGGAGSGEGYLNQPTLLAFDAGGRLFVSESNQGRVQVLRPITATKPVATIVAAGPLTVTPGQAVQLRGRGADSDLTPGIAGYEWTLDGAVVATTANATLATATLPPGAHAVGLRVRDDEDEYSDQQSVTLTVAGNIVAPRSWTFMLYLAGDSPNITPYLNADSQLGALFRLQQAAPNERVTVVALYDGDRAGGGDTFRYLLRPGQPPAVEPRPEANMGDGQTLVEFVRWGQQQAPADAYYLAIADHGNALDGTGWDYTSAPDASERLTNAEMRQALAEITDNGARPLDVLHLDACLMGLLETAYQLRGMARHLVVSENLAWSAFAYEQYRAGVGEGTDAAALAAAIADKYADILGERRLPFTIAALDMAQVNRVAERLDALAGELLRYALASQANRDLLAGVRQQAQKLDSSGNTTIADSDEYVDLDHFAQLVQQQVPDSAAQSAAAALRAALAALLTREHHASGNAGAIPVALVNAHGVGIYYPPVAGVRTYQTYRNELTFAADTLWDEFLQAGLSTQTLSPLPPPNPIAPLPLPPISGPRYTVALPLVFR